MKNVLQTDDITTANQMKHYKIKYRQVFNIRRTLVGN